MSTCTVSLLDFAPTSGDDWYLALQQAVASLTGLGGGCLFVPKRASPYDCNVTSPIEITGDDISIELESGARLRNTSTTGIDFFRFAGVAGTWNRVNFRGGRVVSTRTAGHIFTFTDHVGLGLADWTREIVQLHPASDVFDWRVYFVSPPPVAWLVAPFALLPLVPAFWVFAGLSAAAFGAAGWLTVPGGGIGRVALFLTAACTFPVLIAIQTGQVVPLLAAATVLAWWLASRDRDVLAGLVLVAVVLKPQVAALIACCAGRRRLPWRGWWAPRCPPAASVSASADWASAVASRTQRGAGPGATSPGRSPAFGAGP
jgi:hypothetical protein